MIFRTLIVHAIALVALAAGTFAQTSIRPSVQRLELKEQWSFREVTEKAWHAASVPGCVHTDLMNNRMIPDPFFGTNEQTLQWIGEKDWVYQTTFDVPPALFRRDSIELVFMGLDTYATVSLNDSVLLFADNMFREWRKECKSRLRERGNTLSIRFGNVFDENLPKYRTAPYRLQAYGNNDQADIKIAMYSRKAQFHYGWDWGPRLITCGIWRPVMLEGWDVFRIRGVRVVQEKVSLTGALITSVLELYSTGPRRLTIRTSADSVLLGTLDTSVSKGLTTVALKGKLLNPNLWWTNGLGSQYLYNYTATVHSGDGYRDEYKAKIGVRSLEVVRDKDSLGTSMYIRLNGVPVFMKGADYIPQDNFQNRVTPERYEYLLKSAADAHMNMLRVWGGGIYEDDLFYTLCDRYGILVWHDLMFACAMYPSDESFLRNVKEEILENVRRIRNHPSIALYCGNNENEISWYGWGWKQKYPEATQEAYERDLRDLFMKVVPEAVQEADPGRYYHFSSPSAGFGNSSPMDGDIHYWGVWHGKEPFESFERNIARFVSEYGFQSYPQLSSVTRFTRPADRELHSPVMLSHQRCMAEERQDKEYGNRLIASYMDKMLRTPKDFPSYLYASQVLQAEGVKMAIEAHRRNMPACMGSLFWQIDDCWPVASWSSIDYYGEWKALHYYAKRLYEPVIIAPRVVGDEVTISVVSDRLDPFAGDLQIRVVGFDGTEVFSGVLPVNVNANATTVGARFRKIDLVNGREEGRLAMVVALRSTDGIVAENVSYFRYPKDLELEKPVFIIRTARGEDGYKIRVTSNTLAKNVYLSMDGVSGPFSDNYFDLLPWMTKDVWFKTRGEVKDFEKKLKVMSLYDSYQ
jgi:beta-mannosidase